MWPLLTSILSRWRRKKEALGPAHLRAGVWGEQVVETFLVEKGYYIIGRRVVVGLRDEFDLISRSPESVLVFVEVKTRANETFGRPFASVNRRKRKILSRAAIRYMKKLRTKPPYFRFDVVEVIGTIEENRPVVRHIENAFPLEGKQRIPW